MSNCEKLAACSPVSPRFAARATTSATELPRESTTDDAEKAIWGFQTVLVSLMVPSLMMLINAAMISVALPAIRSSLGAQVDVVAWVITIYTLPYVILMPLYGRLADGLGKRRLVLAGIAVFLLGTGIDLLDTDLRLLLVGRAIQGVGAAGIVPLAIAMIAELFPADERGKALGTWNSIGPITYMIGPLLAGLLIDTLNWRSIFVPVLLVGVSALLVVKRRVPALGGDAQPGFLRTFDWSGVALLSAAITILLFYVSSESITGVAALRDWRLLTLALLLFGGFVLWEKRQVNPFISLDIFAHRAFNQASFCAGTRMFSLSGISFLMPLYLTDVHGLRAFSIGVVLVIQSASLLVTMRLGGQLADHWGSRRPVVFGMCAQVGTMVYFALLPGTVGLWPVVVGLVVHGLAAGLSLAALHRAAMSQVPQGQIGVAAGLYSMIRFSGTVFSAALGGVILQQALNRVRVPVDAYQIVFWFIAGVVLVGVIVGVRLRE